MIYHFFREADSYFLSFLSYFYQKREADDGHDEFFCLGPNVDRIQKTNKKPDHAGVSYSENVNHHAVPRKRVFLMQKIK